MKRTGQLRDFLHQMNHAHHEAHLGVLIILTAVVGDADVTGQLDQLLRLVRLRDIIRRPIDAAGEVPNLTFHLARELALDPPLQSVRHPRRKTHIEHIHRVGVRQGAELDRRWIDERVRPENSNLFKPLRKVSNRVSFTKVRSAEL